MLLNHTIATATLGVCACLTLALEECYDVDEKVDVRSCECDVIAFNDSLKDLSDGLMSGVKPSRSKLPRYRKMIRPRYIRTAHLSRITMTYAQKEGLRII